MFVKSKAWNVKFIVIFLKNKPHELINKFKKSKRMNQQNVAKEKLCTGSIDVIRTALKSCVK